MPYKEFEVKKIYYSIGDVAQMFNVNTSLIRYWETEFSILKPQKNKKGNRLFTIEDIDNLKIIYHLVKEKGYTLQGAKDYFANNSNSEKQKQKLIYSLERIKDFLLKIKEEL